MNKVVKIVLNILIVVASLILLVSIVNLASSIKYVNREVEDPAETYAGIFDYLLEKRSYGEVVDDYHFQRRETFDPTTGYENLFLVGEYGHDAFMARVFAEMGDDSRASACRERMRSLRGGMGDYAFAADEIDEMIANAP
ncbi:MAG: hypothetical protein K5891_09720 [Lachnospiraceae bacterium]|nr:hypothetical protein [Lachnospiraceae bacterium]